ncbi:hypothetical protein FB45DRAFT_1006924 [Roridomyces roridus]|uniref:Uncharacterized protein n=1 Tax=Roridomyces roridus TaxID=1738132 RepID=A0AAD7BGK0_9AGAR|nr:hypothetical protein FB45DRAFT_1006924 [Roridomyces roridus]
MAKGVSSLLLLSVSALFLAQLLTGIWVRVPPALLSLADSAKATAEDNIGQHAVLVISFLVSVTSRCLFVFGLRDSHMARAADRRRRKMYFWETREDLDCSMRSGLHAHPQKRNIPHRMHVDDRGPQLWDEGQLSSGLGR